MTRPSTQPAGVVGAILLWFALVLGGAVASRALLDRADRSDGSTGRDRSITSWSVAHRTHTLTTLAKWLSTLGSQKLLLPLVAIVAMVLVFRRRVLLVGAGAANDPPTPASAYSSSCSSCGSAPSTRGTSASFQSL